MHYSIKASASVSTDGCYLYASIVTDDQSIDVMQISYAVSDSDAWVPYEGWFIGPPGGAARLRVLAFGLQDTLCSISVDDISICEVSSKVYDLNSPPTPGSFQLFSNSGFESPAPNYAAHSSPGSNDNNGSGPNGGRALRYINPAGAPGSSYDAYGDLYDTVGTEAGQVYLVSVDVRWTAPLTYVENTDEKCLIYFSFSSGSFTQQSAVFYPGQDPVQYPTGQWARIGAPIAAFGLSRVTLYWQCHSTVGQPAFNLIFDNLTVRQIS